MQLTSTFHFLPGFRPDASELTDTSPDPTPPARLDSRHKASIDALLDKVTDKSRERLYQILQVFPAGVLENLKDHGLTFEITAGAAAQGITPNGQAVLGGYDPMQRKIIFSEAVLMTRTGRHVAIHETVHAIDHMRAERKGYKDKLPVLASTRDQDLAKLYAGYLARGAVETITQIRYALKEEHGGELPGHATLEGGDNWGAMAVEYTREDGKETFRIEQQPKLEASPIEQMMGMPEAPDRVARQLPRTEVEVPLHKGGKARVVQEGTISTITVSEGAVSYTGDVWSEYALRSGMVEEYTAEAFSFYLEKGNVHDEMEMCDPDMTAYTQKILDEEFNLRP
ncbi:MAG: hypothetical protein FJX76_09675 [Armatimonadetes bacterium]|nr:hypothetical protein [Armatimonadota bacterium]